MPELAGTAVAALDTVDARTAAPRVLPIEARGIVLRRAGRTILDDVHVRIASHGITALMGPNGAGKSMLLRVLAALVTPDAGQVHWSGAAPRRALRRALGFVFQKPVLLRRSALANIRYALRAAGHGRAQSLARGREALAFAGLTHLARSPARLLSGGEQQRLAIARAVVNEPSLILADEPTSALDDGNCAAVLDLLRRQAQASAATLVVATHDHRLAPHFEHRLELMTR
jgi:tungstate transport system ATP-binding protein